MEKTALWQQQLSELQAGLAILPDKPEETATNTLQALWLTAGGTPRSAVEAETTPLSDLTPSQQHHLGELIAKRLQGIPLAHLTGRQHFMGLELLAGPDALVPRRETELLARTALDKAIALSATTQPLTVVDICTGSGNIALALTWHLQKRGIVAHIFGADLSGDAVALAQRNAAALGLNQQIEFRVGDLAKPFDEPAFHERVDILTCNPPYITQAKVEHMAAEIADHEPHLAFNGGPLGVSILMRLLDEAPALLKAGGWLVFEVGLGQGPAIVKRLQRNTAFNTIEPVCDSHGAIRSIAAQRC